MKKKWMILSLLFLFLLAGCQKEEVASGESQEVEGEVSPVEVLAEVEEEEVDFPMIAPEERGPGGLALTFDDRSIASWYEARKLFKKYQVQATFLVSGLDQISEEEVGLLQELHREGHEIGCHSLNHYNACDYVAEHGLEAYLATDILPALEKMTAWGLAPKTFAYPYGARTEETSQALLEHFELLRGTRHSDETLRAAQLEDIFYPAGQGQRLVLALGIDEIYGNSQEEIFAALDRARAREEIVVFYGHGIAQDPAGDQYLTDWSRLEEIIAYGVQHGLRFYTLGEMAEAGLGQE